MCCGPILRMIHRYPPNRDLFRRCPHGNTVPGLPYRLLLFTIKSYHNMRHDGVTYATFLAMCRPTAALPADGVPLTLTGGLFLHAYPQVG